ncbi:polysaccharide pyruvyl transferase family protein [candidate division KSB1 bacterium]|nr:polysaccharide pyruvyl transferase family protein [candidate division KSB1 bacterium]RQW07613.1 MAG: polysaccharide pyruvyl transferase family protein [candidate division KSB1 bacterium]
MVLDASQVENSAADSAIDESLIAAMRIALITTVQHNPGDDFVRDGIKYLIRRLLPHADIHFENIHKHAPITARYGFAKKRKLDGLDRLLPLRVTRDRILESDLVIQCGAPVYWCHARVNAHCCDNEWFEPLIRRRLSRNHKAAFLNIAGGSCQLYHSDGSEICDRCLDYIKLLYDAARVTTLRDDLARTILSRTPAPALAPVIPCPSLFAVDEYNITPQVGEFIVLNFMQLAGHYSFAQSIDRDRWKTVLTRFYNEIRLNAPVIFACHDRLEIEWARSIDSEATIFYSTRAADYIKFYARAQFGIVNRLHAAYALASLGKPSLVIGNDSRSCMADLIETERLYVNDVTVDALVDYFDRLAVRASHFGDRIRQIKREALAGYLDSMAIIQ